MKACAPGVGSVGNDGLQCPLVVILDMTPSQESPIRRLVRVVSGQDGFKQQKSKKGLETAIMVTSTPHRGEFLPSR